MTSYQSLLIEQSKDGKFQKNIVQRSTDELPDHEILIRVHYSALNFKDAMSSSGHKGITKQYPHQPGVDAAGVIEAITPKTEAASRFQVGDEVIITGADFGMNTPGGLGEYIKVPADWLIKRPKALSLKQSMQFGTAGLTAALCIDKLEQNDIAPDQGPVLVTGATGGVGSIAVVLLANLGYDVIASSGKSSQADFLKSLGASSIVDRKEFSDATKRSLLTERFAAAIDVAGGDTLSNIIKSIKAGGSVSCCGVVASPLLNTSVFPFILRGINLLGVDAVEIPLTRKQAMWDKLSDVASLPGIELLNKEINLLDVPEHLDRLLKGGMVGHIVVNMKQELLPNT